MVVLRTNVCNRSYANVRSLCTNMAYVMPDVSELIMIEHGLSKFFEFLYWLHTVRYGPMRLTDKKKRLTDKKNELKVNKKKKKLDSIKFFSVTTCSL